MKKLIPESNISSIICLDFPHQLLPALTALQETAEADRPVLLFLKSHQASRMNSDDLVLIQKMLGDFPNIRLFLATPWMGSSRLPVKLRARFLSKTLKNLSVKNIFFAHDVSGDFIPQVLMHVFPNATRICYGDALGLVYSNDYFEKLMFPQSFSLRAYLSKLQRRCILPKINQRHRAHRAVLAIPCDPGKDFMENCTLTVPRKEVMCHVALRLKKNLQEFSSYLTALKNESKLPLVLLATSNLTKSKITTQESEIALYRNIIENEIPSPARILIKPHPGADAAIVESLKKLLDPQFEVLIFEKKYNALPIELTQELFGNLKILSISYASISMAYLFGQPVTHALNDALIAQYILKDKQAWFKEGNDLYLSIIAGLKNWDGNSMIELESYEK